MPCIGCISRRELFFPASSREDIHDVSWTRLDEGTIPGFEDEFYNFLVCVDLDVCCLRFVCWSFLLPGFFKTIASFGRALGKKEQPSSIPMWISARLEAWRMYVLDSIVWWFISRVDRLLRFTVFFLCQQEDCLTSDLMINDHYIARTLTLLSRV